MRGIPTPFRTLTVVATLVFLLLFSGTGMAQTSCTDPANCVTIMHTNDWHSRMLAAPNADYTWDVTGDDTTIGGVARLATKMGEVRTDRGLSSIPVLLLDGGDFTMGTLFHLLGGEADLTVVRDQTVVFLRNARLSGDPAY